MKIRKVYAVYFSPAGHTKNICEMISRQIGEILDCEKGSIDFTLPSSRLHTYTFKPEDLVIFGVPTYAGRIPNKILPFVQCIFKGNNTPAAAVVTFGNRNFDSSLTELVTELASHGFLPFAAAGFVCEHVFTDKVGTGRPDQDDINEINDFSLNVSALLRDALGKNAPVSFYDTVVVRGGVPVAPYYTPLRADSVPAKFLKAKPLTDLEKCDNCGICAKVCPMGSIDTDNVSNVPGICIKCQACIKKCPKDAKYMEDPDFLSHTEYLETHFTSRKPNEMYYS